MSLLVLLCAVGLVGLIELQMHFLQGLKLVSNHAPELAPMSAM
jgi:hypothetical protein